MHDFVVKPSVLVIQGAAEAAAPALRAAGYEVMRAAGPSEGLEMLEAGTFDVVLCALELAGMDSFEFLEQTRRRRPGQVVVMVASRQRVSGALEAMRRGAFHYVTRPLDHDELLITVQRASERSRLLRENRLLQSQLHSHDSIDNLVGRHGSMEEVARLIRKVAPTATTVMIYGESGTGKELVARAVHQLSPRASRPLHAINCASIPETLLESELFGYERGAFTGAYTRKKGLLELASGSTLFLDEVGDLLPALQGKLLRVLQERRIQRLGGRETIAVDLRILSASHRDLAAMVAAGTFRQDLYYRLNTFPIVVPPLRERATDIPLLAEHFLDELARREGVEPPRLTAGALRRLLAYSWPGNVRELESAIERAFILSEDGVIAETDLPQELLAQATATVAPGEPELPPEGIDLAQLERRLILQAMERSGWVVARAAPRLGLTYRTLQYRLGKLGISARARRRAVSD